MNEKRLIKLLARTKTLGQLVFNSLVSIRRGITILVALGILVLEIIEYRNPKSIFYHAIEFLLYLGFIILAELLVEVLLRSMDRLRLTTRILNHQHQVDLAVMQHGDWTETTRDMLGSLVLVAPVAEAGLFIYDPLAREYRTAAHWLQGERRTPALLAQPADHECYTEAKEGGYLTSCKTVRPDNPGEELLIYYLTIVYADHPLASYRFILLPGEVLSDEQKAIYENLREVVAIVLKGAQDRQTLQEMRAAEASLAERRQVSQYLHDKMGQNLAFLHLKLEQLLRERERLTPEILFGDLQRMKEVAKEANDNVRGVLQSMRPETLPVLTNILREYCHKVAQRAKLAITFTVVGKPVEIPPEAGQAVFFAFQEVMNNIEMHSASTEVNVQVSWAESCLGVEVTDNGKGFDPDKVDTSEHFGLEIMHERIARVAGHIDMVSAKSGTAITISIPLSQYEIQPAGMV